MIIFSINLNAETNKTGLDNLNKIDDDLYTITGSAIEDLIEFIDELQNELETEKENNLENQDKINKLENLVDTLKQKREDENEQALKTIELKNKEISIKNDKIVFQEEQIENYKEHILDLEIQVGNWKEQAGNYKDLYKIERNHNLKWQIGSSAVAIIALIALLN